MNNNLRRRLHRRLAKLANIPCINSGGCGYSALAIYDYLVSQGIEAQLEYIIDDLHKVDLVRRASPYAPAHVMVRVGTRLIDSEGIHAKRSEHVAYFGHIHMPVTRSYVVASLDKGNWNRHYDRGNNSTIGAIFS